MADDIPVEKRPHTAAEWELEAMRAGWHSSAFIIMFLGYLNASLHELRTLKSSTLLELFAKFEQTMSEDRE
jgi:hypothetical protein